MERTIESYIRNIFHYLRFGAENYTADFDITPQQGRLLEIIVTGLECGKNVNRRYLESIANVKGSSITSLLIGLKNKGFITKTTSKYDGRAVSIAVTEKGKAVITRVRELFVQQEKQLLLGISKSEKKVLFNLLERMTANIKQIEN